MVWLYKEYPKVREETTKTTTLLLHLTLMKVSCCESRAIEKALYSRTLDEGKEEAPLYWDKQGAACVCEDNERGERGSFLKGLLPGGGGRRH